MTYEQALNFDQKWTAEQAFNDLERYLLRDEKPAYKAVALGMQAIQKQMPKKPEKELIRNDNYNDGSNVKRWDWWCPCCNFETFSTEVKHCPCCGQALDWSDTE